MTSEVGIGAGRLLVSVIVNAAVPEGTVMITGDQPAGAVAVAAGAAGFRLAQVEPTGAVTALQV